LARQGEEKISRERRSVEAGGSTSKTGYFPGEREGCGCERRPIAATPIRRAGRPSHRADLRS
jgi:hypothetical protein